MASTPHRSAPTPTSRPTWTPCSRMNNMTLNSRTGGNRTKIINNCRPPSFDVNQRFLEIACEDDDEPDHPNLTMVFNKHKISFDQLLDGDNEKAPLMLLSDDDESDEEIVDTTNSYSPGRMSLSPDRGFPTRLLDMDDDKLTSPVSALDKRDSIDDQHYDPDFTFADGIIYEDDSTTTPTPHTPSFYTSKSSSHTDSENVAPSLWLRYHSNQPHKSSKKPVGNSSSNNSSNTFVSLPLQEITIDSTLPRYTDDSSDRSIKHAYKKKIIGDRPHKMRMMRSLSPTREDMRKGKERQDDASFAFFLAH